MSLAGKLMEKSWENTGLTAASAGVDYTPATAPAPIALRFFLAVISILFFLFIITFLSRSQLGDFQALAGEPWQPLSNPAQLWLNTASLLASGIAIQLAGRAAARNRLSATAVTMGAALLFACMFLIGQLFVWQQLVDLGYYVHSNPANSYFYMFTAVHGVHLVGGLVALGYVTRKLWRGSAISSLHNGLSLCATYWHFLFVVWLLLFGLLASSQETYQLIAQFCGF